MRGTLDILHLRKAFKANAVNEEARETDRERGREGERERERD